MSKTKLSSLKKIAIKLVVIVIISEWTNNEYVFL